MKLAWLLGAILSLAGAQELPDQVLLPEGTEVALRTAQDLSSKVARDGETMELELAQDLVVGDVIVARAGARALAEVVKSKRPDFWGEAGSMSLRLRALQVGKQRVELRGAFGSAGTRYVVVRGSEALIKSGTPIKAFVAEDTRVVPIAKLSPK